MNNNEEGYSMPLSAPAYTSPPFVGTPESKLVVAPFLCEDEEALRFEIPPPLELGPDRLAMGWMGDFYQPNLEMGLFHEPAIAIQVKYKDIVGWYFPYIWISKDNIMVLCREVYGWPYLLCEDSRLRMEGSQILGDCRRYGETLLRISLNITSHPKNASNDPPEQLVKDFSKLMGDGWITIKKIPASEAGGQSQRQILLNKPEDIKIHEIWSGTSFVEIGGSGYFPNMYRLRPKKFLKAYYVKMQWILSHPKVLLEK